MIYLIGGTHECREICIFLKNNQIPFILSVATDLGEQTYREYANHLIKARLDGQAMGRLIQEEGIHWIIDASHPHATDVSKTAEYAANTNQIRYTRFARPMIVFDKNDLITFKNFQEAFHYLSDKKGNMMITGSKCVESAVAFLNPENIIVRVTPFSRSLIACESYGIPAGNIIAMKGPISLEMNRLQLKEWNIKYFVFKESGLGSGFLEKLEACSMEKVIPIMIESISHDERKEISTYEGLYQEIILDR